MAQVTALSQCSSKPKLSELQKYVKPHAADKWEDIGTALELFDDDLDGEMLATIEKSSDRFNATMRLWLKTNGPEATWDSLLACLKDIEGLEGAVKSIEGNVLKMSSEKQFSSIPDPNSGLTPDPNTPMPVSTNHPPASSPPMSVIPESTVTSLHSQPPVAIPPPDSIAGQLPYAISGPQPPFPPAEDEPSPSEPSGEADFSLRLEGRTIRNYQWELAEPGVKGENYIFIAPTGSGKTLVAAVVISEHLKKTRNEGATPQSKVIFIVNTKPLAVQQQSELEKFIRGASVECCMGDTGSIGDVLPHADIIVCTAGKLLDDLRKDKVTLSQISLVVIDECHHTKKNTPQAKVMEKYLEKKEKHGARAQLPQIVGLTASPGAGENNALEVDKTIEHLVTLCALMDATSGIKVVRENRAELDQFTNKPSFTLAILNRREPKEEFISIVEREMENFEQQLKPKVKCPSPRWSQEYETSIQNLKHPLELSNNPEFRDQISILRVLRCLSQVLNIYMDLRNVDAISVLEEFDGLRSDESLATPMERVWKHNIRALLTNLSMLPPVENPLLKTAEEKLRETFAEKRESRGIVFVRTKKHAAAICDWISHLQTAPTLDLKPRVLTGHTRETGSGMTQVAQEEVMKSFHKGECNLLVATSVAEEGLDVPACNLVIRFQHVSNEIAKYQTVGRARAEDSEGLTILSSDSKKKLLEMKNEERLALVEKILENGWLPASVYLAEMLAERQKTLLSDRKLKQKLKRQTQRQHSGEEVRLLCKACKTFACYGSDVFTAESTTQYLVPQEDFQRNFVKKPHHTPGNVTDNVAKTHKIHCANCDADWGIMCIWHAEMREFPVLKCKSFVFEVKGIPRTVRQWSQTPFEKYPLSTWLALQQDESEDSD